jgi:hypothetical protein
MFKWIPRKGANNMPVNKTEFSNECAERLGKHITQGRVDFFLLRHQEELFKPKVLLKIT